MAARIEDYALIGDCETAALVSREGSIDWLCWPRFDSDACFAALLGTQDNGRWKIASVSTARISRKYRKDTLILETRFETATGTALLIDFMPLRGAASDIVRIVVGERGHVAMRTELVIRFNYGADVPWMSKLDDDTWRAIAGPDMLILRTKVALHGENMHTVGDFTVRAGERIAFTLTYTASHLKPPHALDVDTALKETERYWQRWVAHGHEFGQWREQIVRSLITLRALIYAPTGGMVAAVTTSLPECLGGVRNWDYRFCWLRDATLTLLALMGAGYYREAAAWRDWLLRAVAGSPDQMQIMYGLAGERRLTEWEVPWLPGYENSSPVRIGNGAHAQVQLDVYGELSDALYVARRGGLAPNDQGWALQRKLLEHLESAWREADRGLWEVRGPTQHFTFSKVMAWVAFDRAVKSVENFGESGPVEHWRAIRNQIYEEVCARGFNSTLNSFVQSYDSAMLDASLLLLPALGFIAPDDSRFIGTVHAVERELLTNGLVCRYDTAKTEDGLPPGEGTFLACSFWLADAYAMIGRTDDAHALFHRLVGLCNDVGLLAEQYDHKLERQVGNFPQAFSHVALINTAYNLERADKPADVRAETPCIKASSNAAAPH
jgi:GH15 family glucan-1,4-alpha-glucosidase